ncbi:hypothetical protein KCV05_g51, partial [Aureobasidium melanogenum]
MALLYGYLFRVLCVLSILSSCFGNRVEGSHGIGKGIVEGARKPLEGGSVVSEHSAVDENKAVVSTLDRCHLASSSYCCTCWKQEQGYRPFRNWWPLKEGSASRNRLIEEVAACVTRPFRDMAMVSWHLCHVKTCYGNMVEGENGCDHDNAEIASLSPLNWDVPINNPPSALSYRFSGLERPRNIGFSVHRCVENLLINSLLVLYYQGSGYQSSNLDNTLLSSKDADYHIIEFC